MSHLKRSKSLWVALWPVVLLFAWPAGAQEDGVVGVYQAARKPVTQNEHDYPALKLPRQLVQVKIPYQGGRFWTETRKDKITRFACSQCHNNKPVVVPQAKEMAHGRINLDHGGTEKPLSCFTCHARDERDLLETEAGEKVDLNHVYNLCGQCHFRQKKDWVGGAHGKRVANWAGRRVVVNCTACHDPHSPRFKERWPKTYSPPLSR